MTGTNPVLGGYQGIAVMWRRPLAHSRRVWPPEA